MVSLSDFCYLHFPRVHDRTMGPNSPTSGCSDFPLCTACGISLTGCTCMLPGGRDSRQQKTSIHAYDYGGAGMFGYVWFNVILSSFPPPAILVYPGPRSRLVDRSIAPNQSLGTLHFPNDGPPSLGTNKLRMVCTVV